MRYQPIENYGIIGDLHTAALVGMDGSIDFLCFPRFDSPPVFNALLDAPKGGRFQISPVLEGARQKQLYLSDTNILLTRFLSDDGVAEISDYMPVAEVGHAHQLVRRVKTVRGKVRFRMTCDPRFDYGRDPVPARAQGKSVVWEPKSGPVKSLRLQSAVPLTLSEGKASAEFELEAGGKAHFVLGETDPARAPFPLEEKFLTENFKRTVDYWRAWVSRSQYKGRWREMVNRSALTLKLLTSSADGSMVAAPTFGLPEEIGGVRNWDYRYTWVRDSSFTLYGLMRLGYVEEARAYMRWIEARLAAPLPDGSLQIMYGLQGEKELPERELAGWDGYRGSRPVRVGNAASGQLQLDIYGELMDSVYLFDRHGETLSHDLWADLVRVVDWVCANWERPDDGVWEVRGGRQEFLYSRFMCWVAVDRAVRLSQKRSYPAPLTRWQETRDRIYRDIFEHFWDKDLGAFVQHRGAKRVDASTLLMPLVKFISPADPRWLSTLKVIGKDLVSDSLVYRYRHDGAEGDGLSGREGTFSMCTFWYVECLSRAGDLDRARFFFEKMLGYANHLGLYSEELGPKGEHLGNFPQAFTHLALISAAFDLDRRLTQAGKG
ncbi:MAG TPA: glycoside hydrolase family 15 protein [bacterium]|nr:glycoside hydrolase family 15 protein [bacterium]